MLSANAVAQKPGGSFRPLSSLAHVWLPNRVPALNRLLARNKETPVLIVESATRAYERVFFIGSFHSPMFLYKSPPLPRRHCCRKTGETVARTKNTSASYSSSRDRFPFRLL